MPYFICPNCKNRSIDHDRRESLTDPTAVGCHRCGFGFLFELMDDYYAAPSTGLVVCDADGRILAAGRGVFELTGYEENELMGREVVEALRLNGFQNGQDPVKIERDLIRLVPRSEWGIFPHLLIWHGRRVCVARAPRCEDCVLSDLCPSSRV